MAKGKRGLWGRAWDAVTGRSALSAEHYSSLVDREAFKQVKEILGEDGYSLLVKNQLAQGMEGEEFERFNKVLQAIKQLHPFTWFHTTAFLCKAGSRETLGKVNDTISLLARKEDLLDQLSKSLQKQVDRYRVNIDFKSEINRISRDLNLSLVQARFMAKNALGEARLNRAAATQFANMPKAPANANKALEAAKKAEELAEKNLSIIDEVQRQMDLLDHTLVEPFDEKALNNIKQADARLQEALEKAKVAAEAFEKSTRETRDIADGFTTGQMLSGVVVVAGVSHEAEPREHPLSAGAVVKSTLEAGAKWGGGVLDAADKADCVQTLGACYVINPVMDAAVDNVVVPVAENVVAPVVVPVIKTGIAVGNKAGEVAAPVVGKGAELVDKHVVAPAADKLTKAFQEPARVADQATWSLPRPW
jgi:hypothetical protein